MIEAVSIKCRGRVQGIFFRATTKELADKLGISGWVKNELDGSVSIHAEGESELLDELIIWCNRGPEMARVDSVLTEKIQVKGFVDFEIRRF